MGQFWEFRCGPWALALQRTDTLQSLSYTLKKITVHLEQTLELSVMSPCLRPVFGPGFTPYPLFQWYPQSKEILLAMSQIWDRGSGETHFGRV